MSFEGYREALESQKQKEDKLNTVQSQLDSMQYQIHSLMSAFSNMQEQPQVDNTAKMLYSSGLLVKAAADKNRSDSAGEQLIKAAGRAAFHATRTKSALTKEAEKGQSKTKPIKIK